MYSLQSLLDPTTPKRFTADYVQVKLFIRWDLALIG